MKRGSRFSQSSNRRGAKGRAPYRGNGRRGASDIDASMHHLTHREVEGDIIGAGGRNAPRNEGFEAWTDDSAWDNKSQHSSNDSFLEKSFNHGNKNIIEQSNTYQKHNNRGKPRGAKKRHTEVEDFGDWESDSAWDNQSQRSESDNILENVRDAPKNDFIKAESYNYNSNFHSYENKNWNNRSRGNNNRYRGNHNTYTKRGRGTSDRYDHNDNYKKSKPNYNEVNNSIDNWKSASGWEDEVDQTNNDEYERKDKSTNNKSSSDNYKSRHLDRNGYQPSNIRGREAGSNTRGGHHSNTYVKEPSEEEVEDSPGIDSFFNLHKQMKKEHRGKGHQASYQGISQKTSTMPRNLPDDSNEIGWRPYKNRKFDDFDDWDNVGKNHRGHFSKRKNHEHQFNTRSNLKFQDLDETHSNVLLTDKMQDELFYEDNDEQIMRELASAPNNQTMNQSGNSRFINTRI